MLILRRTTLRPESQSLKGAHITKRIASFTPLSIRNAANEIEVTHLLRKLAILYLAKLNKINNNVPMPGYEETTKNAYVE